MEYEYHDAGPKNSLVDPGKFFRNAFLVIVVTFSIVFMATLRAKAGIHSEIGLNASMVPEPVVIRDAHNGIWLAGVKKDVLSIDLGMSNALEKGYLGVFHAWNAEKGDPVLGFSLGLKLRDLLPAVGSVMGLLGFGSVYKPLEYASNIVQINTYAGVRPKISANVNGRFMYGAGASLNIPFGVKELEKGL